MISSSDILQGSINPAALSEPLGIAPDYALLCDVNGYDETGNIVVSRVRTVKITMTLFDLREKRIAWTATTSGVSKQSLLFDGWVNLRTRKEDDLMIVRNAILDAMDTVPMVNGFRGGAISPIDRK